MMPSNESRHEAVKNKETKEGSKPIEGKDGKDALRTDFGREITSRQTIMTVIALCDN